MNALFSKLAAVLLITSAPLRAQYFDASGNSRLSGRYVFRQLQVIGDYLEFDSGLIASYHVSFGTINFNSATGTYILEGTQTASFSIPSTYSQTGPYFVSTSGRVLLQNGDAANSTLSVGFLGADGVVVGNHSLFIAVPAGTASPVTFQGDYTLDYIRFLNRATSQKTVAASAQLRSDGAGNIGAVQVTVRGEGQLGTNGPLTESGVSYAFSGGAGTLQFPSSPTLPLRGDQQMYISPDGELIFGGSLSSPDFFVGVRRGSSVPKLDGAYYQIGVEHSPNRLYSFLGAVIARDGGIREHSTETLLSQYSKMVMTASSYPTAQDYSDPVTGYDYTVSGDGRYRIGIGQTGTARLRFAARTPSDFSAPDSSPFIHPMGIMNAASFAPFTAGLAPGEMVNIYGSGLASAEVRAASGAAWPTILGGVQVLVNNRPAALYSVSSSQIVGVIPWATSEAVVRIQVFRNGIPSNTIEAAGSLGSPGVFSLSQTGDGLGAVLRENFTVATAANPVQAGETIQIFLTGLGAVTPTIPDGTPAGYNLSRAGSVAVSVGGLPAKVAYAGLAPGLIGVYQVNAVVPVGLNPGSALLEIFNTYDDGISYSQAATVRVPVR